MGHRSAQIASVITAADRFIVVNEEERRRQEDSCEARLSNVRDKHVFSNGIAYGSVIEAITEEKMIDNIDIWRKVQNSNFRFYTKDFPILSLTTSDALALTLRRSRKPTTEFSKKGREKRSEKADDYARNMFEVVKKIQEEANTESYRGTVRALNERNISTPTLKGEWQVGTLQNLYKRWEEMGLIEPAPKPK